MGRRDDEQTLIPSSTGSMNGENRRPFTFLAVFDGSTGHLYEMASTSEPFPGIAEVPTILRVRERRAQDNEGQGDEAQDH